MFSTLEASVFMGKNYSDNLHSITKEGKHRRISASSSTKNKPIGERTWTDIEPQDYSPTDYSVSKQLSTSLRHGSLPREDDGAIEFWWKKGYLQNHFVHSEHLSDEKWKSIIARGGGNKKRFQYCTDSSGEILYLRALQGHWGRNLIDPSLQDNVVTRTISLVRYTFIQMRKKTHPKTLSSKNTFVQKHFRPKTLSSQP